MFGCCLCYLYGIQNWIGRYELIQMVDIEWHVFQWTEGFQRFYVRSTPVIVDCWSAGRMWKNIKWCALIGGLCPWVGDPCCKRNCILNRWLGKLQLLCSLYCCVIMCAVQMCRGVECESQIFPPVPVSPSLSVLFRILDELVLSTVPCSVFISCMY